MFGTFARRTCQSSQWKSKLFGEAGTGAVKIKPITSHRPTPACSPSKKKFLQNFDHFNTHKKGSQHKTLGRDDTEKKQCPDDGQGKMKRKAEALGLPPEGISKKQQTSDEALSGTHRHSRISKPTPYMD
jgi:hypothetical protein